ncbi:beta-1,4-glucuronyltransferase 1-like [Colias croceus]|uniref:beta-1,4-glucuronyltransferase 1-like n=1 Tax=Colias crocea TaxID=72248 RepID=UPI001E28191D|nr:beta-1,4-glucuronyltransferase 1-like [Colias croceus]
MSRCIRVCAAYTYRLTRRHSTLFIFITFVVTLTVIFHFYAFKHNEHPHASPQVGDFEYRPGAFLRGRYPHDNRSYCQFNYGLPNYIDWGTFPIFTTPEAGINGPYRVIYNAIRGMAYANNSKYDAVTYATQATPEFIYHIAEIAKYWDGPISLAVYVPNYDMDITIQIMKQLCSCYPGMSKVSLHLFYPKRHPPKIRKPEQIIVTTEISTTTSNVSVEEILRDKLERYKNLNPKTRAGYVEWVRKKKIERMMAKISKKEEGAPNLHFVDCSGPEVLDIPTFRRDHKMIYPINVGRNVARNASKTNYFIVSDIEMVPSDGLAPKFLRMVRKLMGDKKRDEGCIFAKTVFVVPLFEVERGEEIPHDKDTLVNMVTSNRAMYFHQKVCSHCQRFPGLQTWLLRPSPDILEPMLIARREYPYHRWEPLYFGTHREPWYSESLSWEGKQDKMTQMLELCLQEYRMVVLDGGFLCHAAISKNTSNNARAQTINRQRYQGIISSFKQNYPDRPKCKLTWGCGQLN